MGRIAWSRVPSLRVPLRLADPPDTEDLALTDWMQQAKTAMERLAEGNAELESFLDDVLDTIKNLDRDGLAGVTEIADTADVTYSANEVTMLNNLKTAVNGILANT